MIITRQSTLTGETHQKEINVTQSQIDNWQAGVHIQNAMPQLSIHDREFIMTGITSEEWDEHFAEDEDYEMEDLRDPNGNS